MTTKEFLIKSLKVLRSRGWTQGTFHDANGQVCALGAVQVGGGGSAVTRALHDALPVAAQDHRQYHQGSAITKYNDKSGRHQRTIEKLFERAIKATN